MKSKVQVQFPPGNEAVQNYLLRMVDQGSIAHSLLFAGPESAPKLAFATAFAARLIGKEEKLSSGSHPDLHILRPEGKLGLHSMESLRQFIAEVYLPPFESSRKVFILEDAHRMWPYSANALLKTFEEPPKDTVIILLSHRPEALLPTILSRCRTVRFQGVKESQTEKEQVLLPLLICPKFNSYKEFQKSIKTVAESLEKKRKEIEESVREEMGKQLSADLNAAQKQPLEKQAESAGTMALQEQMDQIFSEILAWYRDMHLIRNQGDQKYLHYPELIQSLQRGDLISMETILQAVSDAKLALERSLPIAHCLENLFLKLNRIC